MVEPADRAKRTATIAFFVVFLLGVAAGVGLAPLLRPPQGPLPPSLEALGLSASQRARIEAIVHRHGAEVEAALGEARPRLRAVQERVAGEIERELTEAQRAQFRAMRASRRAPAPDPR